MHLARLLFLDVAHLLEYGILLWAVFMVLYAVGCFSIGILRLMKEIIKRIDIDPIEGFGLFFAWMFFGGPLLNSFNIMLLEHDTASFIMFVFFLIVFLIASPLLFYPVRQAYNKMKADLSKEKK